MRVVVRCINCGFAVEQDISSDMNLSRVRCPNCGSGDVKFHGEFNPRPLTWKEQLDRLVHRWRRVWRKHRAHREHRGTRRKP